MARGILATILVLACVGASLAGEGPTDFCEMDCVKEIYASSCGGATCVAGVSTDEQRAGLCSEGCGAALGGEGMLACLSSMDERPDWTSIQEMIVSVRGQVCGPFEPIIEESVAQAPEAEDAEATVVAEVEADIVAVDEGVTGEEADIVAVDEGVTGDEVVVEDAGVEDVTDDVVPEAETAVEPVIETVVEGEAEAEVEGGDEPVVEIDEAVDEVIVDADPIVIVDTVEIEPVVVTAAPVNETAPEEPTDADTTVEADVTTVDEDVTTGDDDTTSGDDAVASAPAAADADAGPVIVIEGDGTAVATGETFTVVEGNRKLLNLV